MTVDRDVAKRQVAAARNVLVILHTRALRPSHRATDIDEIAIAFRRLSQTTEDLAKAVYQPSPRP